MKLILDVDETLIFASESPLERQADCQVGPYLGDSAAAVSTGEELIQVCESIGQNSQHFQEQVQRIREGEPLCRIVCDRDEEEWELDQLPALSEGRYEFQFRRNRMSLQKAIVLVQQGNRIASDGQLADALEKYQEASEVDPYDPDPWYQRGMCLLELGTYAQAKEAFEEVERLAPGWFRCRSDFWLAKSLEEGLVSDEEFRLLRALEDGGLDPEEGIQVAQKAVESYPHFAPFYLSLGDYQHRQNQTEKAFAFYRKGLELVEETRFGKSALVCDGRCPAQ